MPKIITELPGPRSRELLEKARKYEPHSMSEQVPVVWDRAQGCVIWDVDGNEFLDWCSGVLVTNVGHCHPDYVAAVKDQAEKLFNCYDFTNEPRALLAEKLVQITPPHLDKAFLLTTGSDATEAAIRMARRAHEGWEILAFHGAFHGRTLGAASAGGSLGVKKGYGPLVPGFIHAPYPYCYRCPFGHEYPDCNLLCLEFIDWVVSRESCGALCAVMTESYQGGAGSIIPPPGWYEGLEKWRKLHGLYLIFDEVQSSFGRTGKWFCMEHWDIEPDLVCLGKGLGSGVPCSAVMGRHEIMDVLPPGSMSSTNGGNPLSCRAALAAIEIIERENLVENAARMGEIMRGRFEEMKQAVEQLGDVRGMGLVWGLEIVEDKKSKEPAPELSKAIVHEAFRRGLIMIAPIGMFGNVLRVAPPLVINEQQVQESLDIFEAALRAACGKA
ncbi:MAG: aspartate aminotransferase family protein [Armatimonadetes bacterium]|nr:aspartate aminotransferase family protein [Armatimonadota bacterium]